MAERESSLKTLAVAAAVALLCSLFVSAAVFWLRPIQLAYRSIAQNRAILEASGIVSVDEIVSERAIVNRYLEFEAQLVDLDSGRYADAINVADYDYRRAIDDPRSNREIVRERDVAGLGWRPLYMPVYLLRDGRSIERIVLPIYGRGMWSTIHGYISIGSDIQTIAGVRFYEHGETPGIGDRIQNPAWAAQWIGRRVYADDGSVALRVGSGGGDTASASRVDAITGATVTVVAVDKFVRYWLGEDGYGPFLANLRGEGQ